MAKNNVPKNPEPTSCVTPLMIKAAVADILVELGKNLDSIRKNTVQSYEIIGKSDTQAVDWKTKEPLWEDEEQTIPKYEPKWGWVDIPESEFDEEQRAKLSAITLVAAALERIVSVNVVR